MLSEGPAPAGPWVPSWDLDAELRTRTPLEILLDMLRAYFPGFDFGGQASRPEKPGNRQRMEAGQERHGGERRRHAPERPPTVSREPDPVLARCYAELGVPYGADFRQVRRAWRRLMRQHHPDLQGEDAERQRIGTEQVKRFNNAFEEIGRHLREGQGGMTHA